MPNQKLLLIPILISLFIISCGPSIKVTSSGETREPKSKDYKMLVLDINDRLPDKCVSLGEISVYDAGLAEHCSYKEVLSKAIKQAKTMGADAIKLTEVLKPDFWCTCYRIKALAIAYNVPGNDSITYEKPLAPPDSSEVSFISFDDCYPCIDLGNLNSLSKTNTKINLLPFFIYTVSPDGRHNVIDYPIIESRMKPHFQRLLKSYNWRVNYISNESDNLNACVNYYGDLLTDIISGKGNPLDWGKKTSIDLEDTNSIIYIPFAVEREAQHHVNGRFYVLIADSKGKIQFCRCFDYNPLEWSSHFNSFANDIEKRLPLASE